MKINYDNSALDAISGKFNEGINDVTPVTIALVAGVLIVIILSVLITLRNRRRTLRSAEASYQSLIRRFDLTIREIDLIEKLVGALKKPEDKYHLLVDKNSFRQAVRKIEDFSDEEQILINRLREKVGFLSAEETGEESSTKALKPKSPVIIGNSGEYPAGEIYSTAENNITVKYPQQIIPIIPHEEILLFASVSAELKVFKLIPERVKEELFSAPHVSAMKYYKLNTKLEISVEIMKPEGNSSFKSRIGLLSEKGAIILDKRNVLETGDRLSIYLRNDTEKKGGIEAEVIKTSSEKNIASLKFIVPGK